MTIDTSLTESKIQRVLGGFIASPKYRVDGLFVFGWESDKLIWTKAGYIYEFEIKISRSDYLSDFRHKVEKHLLLNSALPDESTVAREADLFGNLLKEKRKRYPQITRGEAKLMMKSVGERMPNFFYYAVPEGLLDADEVPPYAGLVYITTCKDGFEDQPDKWLHHIKIVRKAPQLHKTKYTDAELNLGEKFYYNWQTALRHQHDAAKRADTAEGKLQRELDRQHHDRTWEDMERDLEYNKERSERYSRLYYEYQHNALIDRQEIRLLRRELLKLQPDFDYKAIEQEAERYHGKRATVEI